jgi:hypothetical protein
VRCLLRSKDISGPRKPAAIAPPRRDRGYYFARMITRRFSPIALFVLLLFITASCSRNNPKVALSPQKVQHHGHVDMKGTGFTPSHSVSSHLRRPDGTEFPVLPILTDDRGEFTHDIDTLLLAPGIHEVWVVDDATNTSSEIARFEVVLEAP